MAQQSTWKKQATNPPHFDQLKTDLITDIAIVGGGITGLMLAYLLKDTDKKITILEAENIGEGTTGYSSNHLATHIDVGYRTVDAKFNSDAMKTVASSRIAGIDKIEEIVRNEKIECDFNRVKGFLYAEKEANISQVEEEHEYSKRAGLKVKKVENFDLPLKPKRIYQYDNQAIINMQKFLNGLAEKISENINCKIYCNSEVLEVDNKNKKVITKTGTVEAEKIILATHIPLFINVLQTMVVPYRSYMVSARLKDDNYPAGLYWDAQEPYHYTRTYEQDGEKWLLVGGADHETGKEEDVDHYAKIKKYVKAKFDVKSFEDEWSAQYYEPSDGLPYIGKSPFSNVYIATGYSGDGLVYGVVAAMLIADEINGINNDWSKVYNARRFKPLASAKDFISHNTDVAKNFLKDYLSSGEVSDLEAGQGTVLNHKGNKFAVSKNKNGDITAVNAICPHMGCIVHWNEDESTWDCPCHGSRFHSSGQLIEGPAVNSLEKYDLKDEVYNSEKG